MGEEARRRSRGHLEVGTGKEELEDVVVAVEGRHEDGRAAVRVGLIQRRARVEEELHEVHVAHAGSSN